MIITGVDIETTGLEQAKGHRIIEIGFEIQRWEPGFKIETLKSANIRINPMRNIDKSAQNVHGIDLIDLADAPEWEEVAPVVAQVLEKSDMMVAHNADFDLPFIAFELLRIDIDVPSTEVFCTMEQGRHTTPLGKLPNLGELCFAFGVSYDPEEAHAALYDIDRTMKCFEAGVRSGLYKPAVMEREGLLLAA